LGGFPCGLNRNQEFLHLMNKVTFHYPGWGGRLGNQLFYIAATLGIARRTGRKLVLPHWAYRNVFKLPNEWFDDYDADDFDKIIECPHYLYEELNVDGNIALRGYMQSPKFFDFAKEEVREIFFPRQYRRLLPICGMHIRRGDYVTLNMQNQNWHIPPIEYYLNALREINPKNVIIFSDDVAWCKNTFGTDSIFEYGDGHELIDFFTMASCSSIIMASSTFSWWAAYLSGHDNVYMPHTWINGIKFADTEFICDNWKVIENY